ncbi:MAG TPA: C40 family peptidase [Spirochaetota bacterium]|nr:C40 family peptidase [Spirochaetota bacterium]
MRPSVIPFRKILIAPAALILAGGLCCSPPHVRTGSIAEGRRGHVVDTARQYLGAPYRYGGETPHGFDCSGFVMYVYDKNGLRLPRATVEQYRSGRPVSRRALGPGDLVFFSIYGGRISHVGIYAGNGSFIHAPSCGKRVSYARLDNSYWKTRYSGAVSYFAAGRRPNYTNLSNN